MCETGSGQDYQYSRQSEDEDMQLIESWRRLDEGNDYDYVIEFDIPIKMGFAIREYDHDLKRNDDGEIIDFGNYSRFGYFEIVIPSSTTEGQGLAESTLYKPYYVNGATALYSALLALIIASYLF